MTRADAIQERRADERIPLTFPVRIRVGDVRQFTEEHAVNLSAGGIFIGMNYPPPVGTKVEVDFFLEPAGKTIRARGEVVRSVREKTGRSEPTGMGVRFTDLGDDGRRMIELSVRNFNASHPSQVLAVPPEVAKRLGREP